MICSSKVTGIERQLIVCQRRYLSQGGGGGRGTPIYITDGDAHRNSQKKPLKVTILNVAPANFST